MLTARTDLIDVVVGLESGADDYVVKPVQPRVLDARIRAVLRRHGNGIPEAGDTAVFGDLVVDRGSLVVTKRGLHLDLTPMELRLLLELAANRGLVLSRQQLLDHVWGEGYAGSPNVVDVYVGYLRRKLEDPPAPQQIRTVRGVGFSLEPR